MTGYVCYLGPKSGVEHEVLRWRHRTSYCERRAGGMAAISRSG